MQALKCPGAISRKSGTISEHSRIAYGQRVLKTQPEGGLIGEGMSPFKGTALFLAVGSGTGAAARRASVYGCFGCK